jgi:hypothetical protein
MGNPEGGRKRRVFRWSTEARASVREYRLRGHDVMQEGESELSKLVTQLTEISGNPRDACYRFARQMGIKEKRQSRCWTKAEQQRLLDLISSMSVEEASKILRRPPSSVRAMLHRLGMGARNVRDWFTKSSLAAALHISPGEVQKWIDQGWLKCQFHQTNGLKLQVIHPDDFSDFFKQHGKDAVGRRLSYEGLWFARTYVFPPSHAHLLSVRGTYKKRPASEAERADELVNSPQPDEEDCLDQSA